MRRPALVPDQTVYEDEFPVRYPGAPQLVSI